MTPEEIESKINAVQCKNTLLPFSKKVFKMNTRNKIDDTKHFIGQVFTYFILLPQMLYCT